MQSPPPGGDSAMMVKLRATRPMVRAVVLLTTDLGSIPRWPTMKIIKQRKLKKLLKNQCWSLWEGCACDYEKNHDGKHVCADLNCRCSWTSEQADLWMIEEKIELWHMGIGGSFRELYEYLGWTEEQYEKYLEKGVIPSK